MKDGKNYETSQQQLRVNETNNHINYKNKETDNIILKDIHIQT